MATSRLTALIKQVLRNRDGRTALPSGFRNTKEDMRQLENLGQLPLPLELSPVRASTKPQRAIGDL
jgi:hypothetical protein